MLPKCSPTPHHRTTTSHPNQWRQETIRSARGRAPLILISKIHNSSKSMVPLPSSDIFTNPKNPGTSWVPSYTLDYLCNYKNPCWIKGHSEFIYIYRSTINGFFENNKKTSWDAARSCVSSTNQPRLRTQEATHSFPNLYSCSSPKSTYTPNIQ